MSGGTNDPSSQKKQRRQCIQNQHRDPLQHAEHGRRKDADQCGQHAPSAREGAEVGLRGGRAEDLAFYQRDGEAEDDGAEDELCGPRSVCQRR